MKTRAIFQSVSYSYFIVIITALLLWTTFKTSVVTMRSNYDIALVTSFVAIGLSSIFFLSQAVLRCGISLCVIHWFFVLIVFFIVPFLQYLGNLFYYRVDPNSLLKANIYILLWCWIYAVSYDYSIKNTTESCETKYLLSCQNIRPIFLKHKFFILTLVSLLIMLYLISIFGIESFLTRGSYSKLIERVGGWGPVGLIITFYLRPLLFCILIHLIGAVFLFKKIKRTHAINACLIAIFAVNIVINNPISHPRFMLFTMLLGLFILFSFRKVKASLVYISMFFLSLPVFQIFNLFRRSYNDISQNYTFKFDWDFLFRGSFNPYETFTHTINHVNQFGIVYGKQLAGALLFFVPRSFWTNKPVGSGTYIYHAMEKYFDVTHFNIGSPLISEMYLNFHITGIIVGALFYGVITGRLDKSFWILIEQDTHGHEQNLNKKTTSFYSLLYPFLIGLYLFHLRGDFMSSYGYSVGFVMAFLTIAIFLKLRII